MADLILDISAEFLKNLKKADKAIEKIADVSDGTKQRIIQMFQDIDKYGISHVINKTNEMKRGLELLANANIQVEGFKNIQRDAKDAVDEINNLVNSLQNVTMPPQRYGSSRYWADFNERNAKREEEAIEARREYAHQQAIEFKKQQEAEIAKEEELFQERERIRKEIEARDQRRSREMAEEYELQLKYENDRIEALRKDENDRVKALHEYAKQKSKLAELEENKKRSEDSITSASWDAELKRRDAEDKAWAEYYDRRKKEREKFIEDGLKAAQDFDKEQERLKEKELQDELRMERERSKKISEIRQVEIERERKQKESNRRYLSTYEGAMKVSNNAKSLYQEQQAIKYLQEARAKLMKTPDYERKLKEINDAIARHNKNIATATGKTKELKNEQQKLADVSANLTRSLATIFSLNQIKNYIGKIVDVRKEFELQHKSLQIIIQDTDAANKLWEQTVDLALKSPFRVKELVKYTKQLAAYRIETDKLHDVTSRLADMSAGLGVDMQRLILAYGQVRAAEYLRGTELRQFTEAGVPMLDELAKYFTELEGKAVSTAEVFKRISKRMVTFADVEHVIQKMTDAGGVFYKMQEQQAQTLHGMIGNLYDSIDLMMNDIGKANDDFLKNTVAAAKTVVENWRDIATAIESIGAVMAVISIKNFASGFRLAATATANVIKGFKGAELAGAKLNIVLKGLNATIKANKWMIWVTIIATATIALVNHYKKMSDVNKKYDEQANAAVRSMDKLKKYQKVVAENNKIIKDEKSSEESLRKARGENANILSELQKLYPENFENIKAQKDGTLELTSAIQEQNKALEKQIMLQHLGKATFLLEDVGKNYADVVDELGKVDVAITSVKSSMIDLKRELNIKKQKGEISEEQYGILIDKADVVQNAKNIEEIKSSFNDLYAELQTVFSDKDRTPFRALYNKMNIANQDYEYALKTLTKNTDKYLDYIRWSIANFSSDTDKSEFVNNLLIQIGNANEEIRKRLGEDIGSKLKFTFTMPEINTNEEDENRRKQIEEENKRIISQRIKMIRDMAKAYERLNKSFAANESQTRVIESYSDAFQDLFAGIMHIQDVDFTTPKGVVDALKVLEVSGKLTATQMRDVKKAIAEVSTEIDEEAQKISGEQMTKSIEDMFGKYELSLELQKLDIPQDFAKELFDIDVSSLGDITEKINKELASGMWGKEVEDKLKEFQRKVAEMEAKEQAERLKTYLKYTRDAIGERAKIKLEELRKLDEIEQTFEKQKRMAVTTDEYKRLEEAKQRAILGVKKEALAEMQKLEWEQFKSSDVFINMFNDLDNASTKAIDSMIALLEKYKKEWSNLPVDQMKEVAKQLERMKKAQTERQALANPFDSGFMQTPSYEERQNAEVQILNTTKMISDINASIANDELKMQEYAEGKLKLSEEEYNQLFAHKSSLVIQLSLLEGYISRQQKIIDNYDLQKKKLKAQSDALGQCLDAANDLYDAFKDLAEALGADADSPAMIFADMGMNMANTVIQTLQLQLQLKAATVEAGTFAAAMNTAMGVIGWIVMGVQLLTAAINAIVKAHDNSLQKQIESWQSEVEKLQESYEDLSDVIDEAYSLVELEKYSKEMQHLNNQMIDAYKEMIALEEAKKQTDEDAIKDMEKSIKDLQSQNEDLLKDMFSEATDGILDSVKDAARDFTDAWFDAFKETGDGMKGLEDTFDEMIANMIKQQIAMTVVSPYLEKWKKQLEGYIDPEKGDLTLSIDEANKFAETVKNEMPYLNESLENAFRPVADLVNLYGDAGDLTGLQKGIQGITETQAEEISAYLNSIRFFISQQNDTLLNLAQRVLSVNDAENPIVAQLRIIATQTTAINELLNSLTTPFGGGGRGFKVVI